MDASPGPAGQASVENEPGPALQAKSKPVDLSHHYSETTKRRAPSKMKEYYKYFQIPGIGNLAGGMSG